MKSGKWFGLALYHIHCNIEIDVDKIIHRFAKVSSAREEWNWPKSCLNDSETQERGVQGVKIKKKEKRKHEICFCTSLVRFLIRQQLERKYHTRVLFLCELVLFFKRCFLFVYPLFENVSACEAVRFAGRREFQPSVN